MSLISREPTLSKEDEEFLDSLFIKSDYVCSNCLAEVDIDFGQEYTYCEKCECYVAVKKKGSA